MQLICFIFIQSQFYYKTLNLIGAFFIALYYDLIICKTQCTYILHITDSKICLSTYCTYNSKINKDVNEISIN